MSASEFQEEDGEGYFASISDLMVGILFVFLLMLTVFALNFREAEDDQKVAKQKYEQALADKDAAIQKARVEEQRALDKEREADESRRVAETEKAAAENERLKNATLRDLLRRASEQINQDLEDRRNARVRLLGRLEKTLVDQGVKVTLDPASEVLRLPESLLFEVGQSTLDGQAAKGALDKVSSALSDILPCYVASDVQSNCESRDSGTLEGVLIEGHSDRAGYSDGGRRLSEEDSRDRNDHLSMERALTVFKEILQRKKLDQIKSAKGFPVLGVSAYGARRPIKPGDNKDDYQQNRRIDLRFLLSERLSPVLQKLIEDIKALGDAP